MILRCLLICLTSAFLIHSVYAAEPTSEKNFTLDLNRLKDRINAIYDRHEFSQRRFEGSWQSDSKGYTVWQFDPKSKRSQHVRYEVNTGERSIPHPPLEVEIPDVHGRILQRNANLYLSDPATGKEAPLTDQKSGTDIHYEEIQWSPDNTKVLFVETDVSKVRTRVMIEKSDPSYPNVRRMRFARVGETIHSHRIGVVDKEERKPHWLPIPAPEEGYYLGEVCWANNSKEVFVEKLSRFRDERWFLLCNVDTDEVKTIFHETDPAWVVASIQKNTGIQWIEEGAKFIVVSEKDGWRRAYLYSREGEELAVLTPKRCDLIEKCCIDESGGWYYYYASPENATQKYLYRAALDGTDSAQRITPQDQPGTHDYRFSPNAQWAFHTYSSFDQPPITELVEMPEHRVVRTLEDNHNLGERASQIGVQPVEFLTLDIGDNVVMDAWMLKPSEFDPTKKYPVLVYVYGEPHSQTVLDQWGAGQALYHRAIAEAGYVVVSIDNRGTPAPKGAAWRRAVFGSLGPLSTEEQAAGLEEVARQKPYVDQSRVAIWGWSGGGSNTLNAMFRKPEVYHVGIAVVPKPQPHLYNAGFQENYMRDREVNREGYERSAPINFAAGLKGDLLILHGGGETNTHIQIVEGLIDRLIELGKPFDYMVYPNRNHGLSEGPGSVVHVRQQVARYLTSHLPAGPR